MKKLTYSQFLKKHEQYKNNGWKVMAVTPPKGIDPELYNIEVTYIRQFGKKMPYHTRKMIIDVIIQENQIMLGFVKNLFGEHS
jgi:hypothetical protein